MYNTIPDQADSFYVRSAFTRLPDPAGDSGSSPPQLAFRRDEILYVDNTMYAGVPGHWSAWTVDQDGKRTRWGIVPSKYKVEEELLMKMSSEADVSEHGAGGGGGGGLGASGGGGGGGGGGRSGRHWANARRSFFKRRSKSGASSSSSSGGAAASWRSSSREPGGVGGGIGERTHSSERNSKELVRMHEIGVRRKRNIS